MKLGRRRDESEAVDAFWRWWGEYGIHQVSGPAFADDPGAATAELSSRLRALHPALGWGLPGQPGERRLVLSPGGDPTAVIMVERMRRSAPTLEGWSLQIGRGPDTDAAVSTMMVAGHRVDLGAVELAFEPDPLRARLSVSVFHPDFRVFPLPLCQEIALHKLDFEFGEDTVGRWIGAIDIATIRHDTAASTDAVRAAIAELAATPPDEWGIVGGQWGTGAPFVGRVRRTLRWQDHPFLTRQHLLSARYRAQPNGLPTDDEFERLVAIDEALESIGGSAQLVLLVNSGGLRQILLFAREDDVETATTLRTLAKEHGYKLRSRDDPGWGAASQFL
jgi:hypothetical protein